MDIIEKARAHKYQIGDMHPEKPWVWAKLPNGKEGWKSTRRSGQGKQSDGGGQPAPQQPTNQGQPKQVQPQNQENQQKPSAQESKKPLKKGRALIQWAVNASEEDLKNVVEKATVPEQRLVAYRELKHRGKDVSQLKTDGIPLPKVEYKGAPNHHVHVADSWTGRNARTKQKTTVTKENQIKMLEGKDDDGLLKILNNPNMEPNTRHLAMLEAQKRGIPESKIDLSGDRLKKFWDKEKELNSSIKEEKPKTPKEELEEFEDFDFGIDIEDADKFLEQFPEGDYGWDDSKDDRIKAKFGLKTPQQWRDYDNFLYYAKVSNPKYVTPKQQIGRLNQAYYGFFDKGNSRPAMVAAGGAGVGKTTNLIKVMKKYHNMVEFDETDPNQGDDYDYVAAPQGTNSLPKLAKFLSKHPDKILIFDDNDDVLLEDDMANIMKNLTDGNPKKRRFPEYDDKGKATGKNLLFTGKFVILTNKSLDTLNKNEDAKAVMSRAKVAEVKFTIQENIDTLERFYKTMPTGIAIKGISKADEAQLREDIFNYIKDNKDKLDPRRFTVRKFIDIYEKAAEEYDIQTLSQSSASASDNFGDAEDWREYALEILNKGQDDDLNKGDKGTDDLAFTDPTDDEDLTPEEKRLMKKIDQDNQDESDETLDDREQEVDKEDDEKVTKSILNDMSLEEAEELLFS